MNPYVIKSVRRFYGGKRIATLVIDKDGATARFGSRYEARVRINELESKVHRQMVGEYGRPVLSVVRIDKLPFHLKIQIK